MTECQISRIFFVMLLSETNTSRLEWAQERPKKYVGLEFMDGIWCAPRIEKLWIGPQKANQVQTAWKILCQLFKIAYELRMPPFSLLDEWIHSGRERKRVFWNFFFFKKVLLLSKNLSVPLAPNRKAYNVELDGKGRNNWKNRVWWRWVEIKSSFSLPPLL